MGEASEALGQSGEILGFAASRTTDHFSETERGEMDSKMMGSILSSFKDQDTEKEASCSELMDSLGNEWVGAVLRWRRVVEMTAKKHHDDKQWIGEPVNHNEMDSL